MSDVINEVSVAELQQRLANSESFVVNVIADWCPDCTEEQRPHLPRFAAALERQSLPFYNLRVQKHKGVFLSPAHERMTETFGGHGYPRTLLIVNGEIADNSAVEVLDADGLDVLVQRFSALSGDYA